VMDITEQWSIAEVSKSVGVTSRTLRYYESIALLQPSHIVANGLRFYGVAELARLESYPFASWAYLWMLSRRPLMMS
jgi:hypothetical protein